MTSQREPAAQLKPQLVVAVEHNPNMRRYGSLCQYIDRFNDRIVTRPDCLIWTKIVGYDKPGVDCVLVDADKLKSHVAYLNLSGSQHDSLTAVYDSELYLSLYSMHCAQFPSAALAFADCDWLHALHRLR